MMKRCILALVIFSLQALAEEGSNQFFDAKFDNFDGTNQNKEQSMQLFNAVEGFISTPVDMALEDKEPDSGLISVISSTLAGATSSGSVGESFFKESAPLAGNSSPDIVIETYAPERVLTEEDISGVSELNMEALLSSQGFPKLNTALDMEAFPKPHIVGLNEPIKWGDNSKEESAKEKEKPKFIDWFKK